MNRTHTPPRALACLTLMAALAACGSGNTEVRNGPQAVHPSPSALAQGQALVAGTPVTAPAATAPASGTTEARAIFDRFCTPGVSNNTRVTALLASGEFGNFVPGRLPVAQFAGQTFLFYQLKAGKAQIGFNGRPDGSEYCVAVDGTRTGKELYVAGP